MSMHYVTVHDCACITLARLQSVLLFISVLFSSHTVSETEQQYTCLTSPFPLDSGF